jgi:hypothetical protein
MKHINEFKVFLEGEVNLNDTRLKTLDDRVSAVTDFLEQSEIFKNNFIDVIPQGSLAHKTIIKPVQDGDEFDADVLLHLEEFENWEAEDYVIKLHSCFSGSGIYKDKAKLGKRCVTLHYAGDFHIDVVPFLERHEKKYITNRPDNEFELTDPEAYNEWLDDKNRTTGGNLIRIIRLIKYLRDFKETFSVKSFVLNVLLGEQVNDVALLEDPNCYSDIPTTLKTILNRLRDYVQENSILPSIMDPSETGENLSDRWNQEDYEIFRKAIIRYAEWIGDAWTEQDRATSLEKWQRVFGDKFGTSRISTSELSAKSLATYNKTEEQIEDKGIKVSINPRYQFRIDGKVLKKDSMGAYYLRKRGNRVLPGRQIQFEIKVCNVPTPYKIYWKVLNRGEEAIARDCIRGRIIEGDRVWKEPTSFRGSHFVECYIVKDGICVAKDRQPVNISASE